MRGVNHQSHVSAIDLLKWTLFTLAALVAGQASLGFLRLFGGLPSAVFASVLLVIVIGAIWRAGVFSTRRPLLSGWKPLEAGLLGTIAALIATFIVDAAGNDSFTYDSISFHLYFPAAWMHSGRLDIVPMVFGDVAPAYNPSNVELLVHLLMAPFRSVYFAECVQVPFACVAALAIYSTARELGAHRVGSLTATLAFLTIPEVRVQASRSMVDLALGAMFLATLPFLLRLWKKPQAIDVVCLATAWGLFIGTKFVALAFSLPLLFATAVLLWRHRRKLKPTRATFTFCLLLATIVFCTGGFWYSRNLLATGNPIFPLAVDALDLVDLNGLYDSTLMRQWIFHTPVENVGTLIQSLFSSGAAFTLAGTLALLVRWRGPELPLTVLLILIFWFLVPYQHSRFLFGVFGVVAIAIARAAREGKTGLGFLLLLALAIAEALFQWQGPSKLALLFGGLAAACLPLLERRWSMRLPAIAIALGFILLVVSGLGPTRDRYPGFEVEPSLTHAWRWIHANVRDSTIAYTGSNLPFPLFGHNLGNRVVYTNVALGPHAKIHDFSSGQPFTTAEPTLYRQGAAITTWTANLDTLEVEFLFVSSMFPIVRRFIHHDQEGFPVERLWADGLAQNFRLRFANQSARVYQIVRPEPAG